MPYIAAAVSVMWIIVPSIVSLIILFRALLIFRKRHYLVMEQLDVKQTSDSNISASEKDSLLRPNGLPPTNYSTNTAISINKS